MVRAALRETKIIIPAPDLDGAEWATLGEKQSIGHMSYFAGGEASVSTDGAADYATVIRVTPGFFDVFKVNVQLGRLLTPDEQRRDGPPSVVITDAFWRQRFNGNPAAVAATLRFSQQAFAIVGILPPGFG